MQLAPPTFSLIDLLLRRCRQSRHSYQFNEHYTDHMSFYVVEREDRNLCYLTDGRHNILALSASKMSEANYHPTNTINTHYYIFQEKTYLYLNFNGESTEPPKYPHPYNPHFYFKERYQEFLKVRETMALPNPCQILTLTQWDLVLVNVSKTGYYAPAIIIHSFDKAKNSKKSPPMYCDLQCIMYQPFIQQYMQKYRLEDIREYYSTRTPKITNVSMFYLARMLQLGTGQQQNNNIVNIDRSKKILQYDQTKPYNAILASQTLEGICLVSNPSREELTPQQAQKIQLQHLSQLFNSMNLSKEKQNQLQQAKEQKEKMEVEKKSKRRDLNQLWSDSSSEEEEEQQGRMEEEGKEMEDENSGSDDDEDDYLRNLYRREMLKQQQKLQMKKQ